MSFDYENPWQFTAADLPDQDDRTALAVWAGADADEGQRARATPSPRAAPGLEPPWNQLIEEVRGLGEDVRGLRGLRDQLIDDVRGLRGDVEELKQLVQGTRNVAPYWHHQ